LKIRSILLTSLIGLAGALMVQSTASVVGTKHQGDILESIIVDRLAPLRDLKTVSDEYAVHIVDTSHKVRSGALTESAGAELVRKALETSSARWRAYLGTAMGDDERALVGKTEPLLKSAERSTAKLLDILSRKDRAALDAYVTGELYPAIDPLTEMVGKLAELQLNVALRDGARSKAAAENLLLLQMLIAFIGIVIAAAAIMVVVRRVIAPITGMTGVMRTLAAGDKSVVVPNTARQDEIGQMAQTVEVFKNSMIEAERLQAEQRAAEEEKRREQERVAAEKEAENEARAQRARNIEAMIAAFETSFDGEIAKLTSSAGQMQGIAQAMMAAAEETSRQSTAVAAASEQASTNVQTVASASEELAASVAEITRQVAQSSQIARNAADEASRTNAQVQSLAETANRIGDVVRLINDIASQTNLLALNATIEAARAGEAGKGFAVVASEVKTLANQTAKATEEIGSQIAAIQGATVEAVSAIKSIGATISDINDIAATIASAVEQQGAATREIAANVQQAASGTQEVSSNIAGVSQAASDTDAAANQVLAAAGALSEQSNDLRAEVEGFLRKVRAA